MIDRPVIIGDKLLVYHCCTVYHQNCLSQKKNEVKTIFKYENNYNFLSKSLIDSSIIYHSEIVLWRQNPDNCIKQERVKMNRNLTPVT